MTEKYKDQYRIASARWQDWDYGLNAAYFITICMGDKVHYFGKVVNQKMCLSQVGVITDLMWYEIVKHADHVLLGEFVVMPNHIHGIIILNNPNVGTRHALSLRNRFQNQGKNTISSIVGSYKSAVTKHANRLGFEFKWQSRFRDHVIRNGKSFNNISNYIRNNPVKWSEDRFHNKS